jgi:hypothetical protein
MAVPASAAAFSTAAVPARTMRSARETCFFLLAELNLSLTPCSYKYLRISHRLRPFEVEMHALLTDFRTTARRSGLLTAKDR